MYKMMKKGMFPRIAAVMLMLTLLSTCVISGTFAKYVTSDSIEATARVAKWGVEVTIAGDDNGDVFADTYATNDSSVSASITNSVDSSDDRNVLAPGTAGTLGSISISGTPEVAVKVSYEAELTLTGWTIGENTTYCPIVFKVNGTDYKIDGDTIADTAALEAAVENAIEDTTANFAANTSISSDLTLSWRWEFESGNDANDTALGNLAEAPYIVLNLKAIVTQID